MTPYNLVKQKYKFPAYITDRAFQTETVDELAPLDRAGYYAEVGCGKTLMATVSALYKQETQGRRTIIIAPPILVRQWSRWLAKIARDDGPVSVTTYSGTPPQRRSKDLTADFVVMSIQVFKNDFEYLALSMQPDQWTLVLDEATAIKNIESQNYQMVKVFVDLGAHFMALTGTPLATPNDAYAYIKLIAPVVYRNYKMFETIHVEKRNHFGEVTRWNDLDLLKENMKVNSKRVLKRDVLTTPIPIVDEVPYDLSPSHYKVYCELVEEQLHMLPEGEVVAAVHAAKIWACSQQIIWNLAHFLGDPTKRSSGFDLLDTLVDDFAMRSGQSRKLIIFANYRMTIASLAEYLKPFKFGVINGSVTAKQKDASIDAFLGTDACKGIIIQPGSGGKGLDGLQMVCSDALFVEQPLTSIDFEQCTGL